MRAGLFPARRTAPPHSKQCGAAPPAPAPVQHHSFMRLTSDGAGRPSLLEFSRSRECPPAEPLWPPPQSRLPMPIRQSSGSADCFPSNDFAGRAGQSPSWPTGLCARDRPGPGLDRPGPHVGQVVLQGRRRQAPGASGLLASVLTPLTAATGIRLGAAGTRKWLTIPAVDSGRSISPPAGR